MPYGADDLTEGFAFVTFASKAEAERALVSLDQLSLDRNHILKVNRYEDFGKYDDVPETFVAPEIPPYSPRDYLYSWLHHDRILNGEDQFVVHYGGNQKSGGNTTEVFWFDPPVNELIISRNRWTETYTSWSPLGTYLTTFDSQGVKLWGGEEWTIASEFPHSEVDLVDFSPKENYLVTLSTKLTAGDDPKDPKAICIWDVRTGERLRGAYVGELKDGKFSWPTFQWSPDEKYCARIGDGTIRVYECSTMTLLNQKSLKVPGVKECCFSPSQNILAYFAEATGNSPARVVLLDIPSNKELCKKSFVNVIDCKMHWQTSGKYLAARFKQHSPNKKSEFVSFALFRMFEKEIPIDVLDFSDPVIAFSWEPRGDRFAIIHGAAAAKSNVSFYTMETKKKVEEKWRGKEKEVLPDPAALAELSKNAKKKQKKKAKQNGEKSQVSEKSEESNEDKEKAEEVKIKWVEVKKLELVVTLEKRPANALFWSPRGRFIVIAGLGKNMGGKFELYDVNSNESFATIHHGACTNVDWDPSGRYVVTSVSSWHEQFDAGYNIYSFYGKQIAQVYKEKFAQFLWRPRPNLLNSDQIAEIDAAWEAEKRRRQRKRDGEVSEDDGLDEKVRARRKRLREEYYAHVKVWEADRAAHWEEYVQVLGRDPRDEEGIEVIEEIVEEFISIEETILD